MSSSLSFFSYPSCSCAHTSPLQKQVQSASGHLLFSGGQGLVLFPADILLACSVCSIHTHINTNVYVHKMYMYFFLFPIQLSHPLIPSFLADFTIYTFFPILPFVQAFDSPMVDLLLHIICTFLLRFAEICVCYSFN